MQIVKAGVIYFLITFGTGFVLGPIRIFWAVPRFGTRMAELMEAAIMLVVTIVTALFGFLKPEGLFLLAEPIFHVDKKSFLRTMNIANGIGFIVKDMPKIRLSRGVLLARKEKGNGRSMPQGIITNRP